MLLKIECYQPVQSPQEDQWDQVGLGCQPDQLVPVVHFRRSRLLVQVGQAILVVLKIQESNTK